MKDQPKTQGKIEEILEEFQKEYRRNHPNVNWSYSAPVSIPESNLLGWLMENISQLIEQQQNNLIERVIELIGKDEKESVFCSEDLYSARNNLRKELRTKISQIGEEYGK